MNHLKCFYFHWNGIFMRFHLKLLLIPLKCVHYFESFHQFSQQNRPLFRFFSLSLCFIHCHQLTALDILNRGTISMYVSITQQHWANCLLVSWSINCHTRCHLRPNDTNLHWLTIPWLLTSESHAPTCNEAKWLLSEKYEIVRWMSLHSIEQNYAQRIENHEQVLLFACHCFWITWMRERII